MTNERGPIHQACPSWMPDEQRRGQRSIPPMAKRYKELRERRPPERTRGDRRPRTSTSKTTPPINPAPKHQKTDAHPLDASDVTRYGHHHPGRRPTVATPLADSDYLRTDFSTLCIVHVFALTKIAIRRSKLVGSQN